MVDKEPEAAIEADVSLCCAMLRMLPRFRRHMSIDYLKRQCEDEARFRDMRGLDHEDHEGTQDGN